MFFSSRKPLELKVDIHSHLVPSVDDGVKSIEDGIALIRRFKALGYKKLITTPHISESYYPNSVENLTESFQQLKSAVIASGINIELELGAEYMVDEHFLHELIPAKKLLSWNGYLLIESSFLNYPMILDEAIFEIQALELIPVYAHPERYSYFHGEWDKLQELKNRGVHLQINASSLIGHYGSGAKKMAIGLLKRGWVDFIGSDAHNMDHLKNLTKALSSKSLKYQQADDFRNNQLV